MEFFIFGRGPVPPEMIRYDQCFPASKADAALMDCYGRGRGEGGRVIKMRTAKRAIATSRWISHGWSAGEVNLWGLSRPPVKIIEEN